MKNSVVAAFAAAALCAAAVPALAAWDNGGSANVVHQSANDAQHRQLADNYSDRHNRRDRDSRDRNHNNDQDSGPQREQWKLLGAGFYNREGDSKNTVSFQPTDIRILAIETANAGAYCDHVVVRFGSGEARDLDFGVDGKFFPNKMYRVNLPGDVRRVTDVDMTCRAIRGHVVTVRVWGTR